MYRRYFEAIRSELAQAGPTVEIGGGAGTSSDFAPDWWTSDLVATPYVDFVGDAVRLPLADASVANLVMVDVLHHLPRPALFFDEAARVLRRGGRVVMLEPYISPVSWVVFKLAHPEPVVMTVDPLPDDGRAVFAATGPFASNQAIPTLLFGRHLHRFEARFGGLRLRTRRLESTVTYPLSGGFSGPCLVPRWAEGLAWGLERCTRPLRRWMAFRLLVTLERA